MKQTPESYSQIIDRLPNSQMPAQTNAAKQSPTEELDHPDNALFSLSQTAEGQGILQTLLEKNPGLMSEIPAGNLCPVKPGKR